jgi:hypothetical protein
MNAGVETAPLAMLYHVNLGAPLAVPGSLVRIEPTSTVMREPCRSVDSWSKLPPPADVLTEAVFEHRGVPRDSDGYAHANVISPTHYARISWDAAALPRLYQWVLPTRTRWALGIEPSTAPLFGNDRDENHRGAPELNAGQEQTHRLRIAMRKQS